jgi:hypothetical protein
MNNAWDKIKAKWNEDPMTCMVVGSLAATAVAKLISANTNSRNSKTWRKEVARRERNVR